METVGRYANIGGGWCTFASLVNKNIQDSGRWEGAGEREIGETQREAEGEMVGGRQSWKEAAARVEERGEGRRAMKLSREIGVKAGGRRVKENKGWEDQGKRIG